MIKIALSVVAVGHQAMVWRHLSQSHGPRETVVSLPIGQKGHGLTSIESKP
ncbi:MAG: hypothetical protein ABH865_03030 [Candidatus Omnitrophota bacterium]